MSVDINEECKVRAFKYFQTENPQWYTLEQLIFGFGNIHTHINEKLYIIKSKFNDAIANLQDDNGKLLKETIDELNMLTKTYLKDANTTNFDIEIPETAIDECIVLSTEIGTETQKLRELPGGDKSVNIQHITDEIAQLEDKLKALAQNNDENSKLTAEKIAIIEQAIKKHETSIVVLNRKITQLDITVLDIKAKKNLEEIKKKHYEKLLESNENQFNLKKMTEKGETTFLEVQLKLLEQELEDNDEKKIVAELEKKFREKIKNDTNTSANLGQGIMVGYVDKPDEHSKNYPITPELLYNGNENFKKLGDILSGSYDSISSKKSKLFSKVKEGYNNVLTVDIKNINDELEKF